MKKAASASDAAPPPPPSWTDSNLEECPIKRCNSGRIQERRKQEDIIFSHPLFARYKPVPSILH